MRPGSLRTSGNALIPDGKAFDICLVDTFPRPRTYVNGLVPALATQITPTLNLFSKKIQPPRTYAKARSYALDKW